jgi:hypothetical protein
MSRIKATRVILNIFPASSPSPASTENSVRSFIAKNGVVAHRCNVRTQSQTNVP